jgi:ferric-dicitrate binding protein FerR (iron transport regulator)
MAYNDETEIKTSLIEGSVKVVNGNDIRLLKPGQQASIIQASTINDKTLPVRPRPKMTVTDGGTDEAIAWKNGYLQFKSADIVTVMRTISRSYKMDVVFKGEPRGKFSGKIGIKTTTISEVISALDLSGIHARLENNKIVVYP